MSTKFKPDSSGLEPSIHAGSTGSRGMDPRLKAWDDGEWGWRFRQTCRQRTEARHSGCFIRPALTTPSLLYSGFDPGGCHDCARRKRRQRTLSAASPMPARKKRCGC
ncbi:hypothetical protein RHEC894_CH00513 [Rhizobium sp. CIAT894]|nr:hypothetical protein RHEC894_CH00513 [Rhizobium sp. CIAT894]